MCLCPLFTVGNSLIYDCRCNKWCCEKIKWNRLQLEPLLEGLSYSLQQAIFIKLLLQFVRICDLKPLLQHFIDS